MAVSKDSLVLVEFSKNKFPNTFPSKRGRYADPLATGINLLASSKSDIDSSLVRSSIVMRSMLYPASATRAVHPYAL